ncbi:MAG: hypothetical protein ACRD6X_05170 [Pyrinomonadaceae bacterium]
MKHRTEITFEMEETIVIRDTTAIRTGFCPNCGRSVEMATPHVVATISGGSEREIFRLIEAGMIHSIETDRILICLSCVPSAKKRLNDSIINQSVEKYLDGIVNAEFEKAVPAIGEMKTNQRQKSSLSGLDLEIES